jgi:hypothetical protein
VSGTEVVNPLEDSNYLLFCEDSILPVPQNGAAVVSVTIAPEIDIFFADPVSIPLGGSSSLIWRANHANSCIASATWGGVEVGPDLDSFVVSPIADTTYALTCSGPGGVPHVASVTVIVGSSLTVNISASPSRIGAGQSTILSWDTQLALSCTASSIQDPSGWSGPKSVSGGPTVVSPTQDTTYTLDCLGEGGAPGSGSVTVRIADPLSVSLSTSDEVIAPPPIGSARLSWSTTRDQFSDVSCSRSSLPEDSDWDAMDGAPSGNIPVGPAQDTTYTVTCEGDFYTGVSFSVTVSIAPIPTVSLTTDKRLIATGGLVELTWTSTDADRCSTLVASTGEAWTQDTGPASGTPPPRVAPLEQTEYRIECFGVHPTGASSAVVVTVDSNRAVYFADSWGEAVEVRSDRIALVASYEDGLRIVDVSDNTAPFEIGAFDPVECRNETPFGTETTEFILEDVEIDESDEDLVYLSAGSCGMWTLDLGFVAGVPNPTLLSIVDTEGWTEHVTVVEGHAFVSDYNGGVLIFDLTDPAAPVAVASVAFDDSDFGAALEIEVVLGGASGNANDYAYVVSDLGLRVLDVTIPARAFIVAQVDTDVRNGFIPQGIVVHDDLAYLSSWTGGLLFFDVADPTAPLLAGLSGRIATTDYAFYKLVVDEDLDLLYVAEGPRGIRVLDISNADAGEVTFFDQIDIGKFVWDIGRANGELFVGFGDLDDLSGGFQTIIDRPLDRP